MSQTRSNEKSGAMAVFGEPGLRCTAGQAEKPTRETCTRHPDHHWCKTCRGWYGVPHDFGMHDPGRCHDGHAPMYSAMQCACRPCREQVSNA